MPSQGRLTPSPAVFSGVFSSLRWVPLSRMQTALSAGPDSGLSLPAETRGGQEAGSEHMLAAGRLSLMVFAMLSPMQWAQQTWGFAVCQGEEKLQKGLEARTVYSHL